MIQCIYLMTDVPMQNISLPLKHSWEYKLSKCLRHTTREALAGSGTVSTLYRSHRIVCFHGIVMYNLGFNSRPTPVKNTHNIFPVASVAADINQRVQQWTKKQQHHCHMMTCIVLSRGIYNDVIKNAHLQRECLLL